MKSPCKLCPVLVMCLIKFKSINYEDRSVIHFAHRHCELLKTYFEKVGQEEVNDVRITYGLEPLK